MNRDDTYYFHQTPPTLAKELIKQLDISPNDVLCEPFRGEGAFFNHFPVANSKVWAEITEGRDYKDVSGYDWVITNPPFRLDTGGKRVNSFWYLLDYFSTRANKGIAFLANDRCFSSLTPRRMEALRGRGWNITKMIVCSVKKWRGSYFFVVLEKGKQAGLDFLPGNF